MKTLVRHLLEQGLDQGSPWLRENSEKRAPPPGRRCLWPGALPLSGWGLRRAARSRRGDKLLVALAIGVLIGGGGLSCGKSEPAVAGQQPSRWANSPAVCAPDEVREYFCDGLLPLSAALPAPEPYSNCPSTIEHHHGEHKPTPPVAVFDSSYTSYIRKRHPPGHNCCYSWCAPVTVVPLADMLPQAGCDRPLAIRETYCMPTLEGGTSAPASAALPRCPLAIQPPAGKAFSVPPAAPLDTVTTNQRRGYGFDECCYGWCSIQPGGSY